MCADAQASVQVPRMAPMLACILLLLERERPAAMFCHFVRLVGLKNLAFVVVLYGRDSALILEQNILSNPKEHEKYLEISFQILLSKKTIIF